MSGWDWNLIFNGLTAVGTVGAVLVALFYEPIKNTFFAPKLTVTFKNKPRCKVETSVLNNVPLPAMWFRLKIENTGRSIARNIKGKLIEIKHPDNKTSRQDIDPMELHWVGTNSPLIDLNPHEWEYLDVFFVFKEIDEHRYSSILTETRHSPNEDFWRLDRMHLYAIDQTPRNITFHPERDNYYLKVTIYSTNSDSVCKTYKISDAKTDAIKMKEV